MKLNSSRSTLRQVKADGVALFIGQERSSFTQDIGTLRRWLGRRLDRAVDLQKFSGKREEILPLFTDGALAAPRLWLVGVGEKPTHEVYRRAAGVAARAAAASHAEHLAFLLPQKPAEDTASAIAEGAFLSQYSYDKYRTEKKDRTPKLRGITLVTDSDSERSVRRILGEVRIVCEAVFLARDLANAPGNEIYPETLAEAARRSGARHGYRVNAWDKQRISRAGFGGLSAVSEGSTRPPRFIILEHNSGRRGLDTIVLVGKGVTFDAGGISIKPSAGMGEMKMDMSGGAAVIGTLEAASRLKIPLHIVGLIPATENLLGGSAMRPGDIITHYGGKTSEVDNTDAEGRLILADALGYASEYKPKAVIDLATLTGACVVALGHHATGLMGNDEEIMSKIKSAGERTYERVWQLPMFEEYEKQIKSDVADVKNTGGRWGGAITAALFLKKFTGAYSWAHLDIAGPATLEEGLPYAPKGGSGVGVRLLIDLLRHW